MKKIIMLTILFIFPALTNAEEPSVLINEIAWMGNEISSNDEWIELSNNTSEDIDLTGWKLKAQDGSPDITLEGIITAEGFFILERTDDDSAPNITADQIYSGSLSNTGEYLKLINTDEILIDEINGSEAWLGGDNTTKQTLERKNISSWQTSLEPNGTPRATNSASDQIPDPEDEIPEESLEEETQNTLSENSTTAKKGEIIVSEIFPNPEGIDIDKEFIELFNNEGISINLAGWQLDDEDGGSKPYTFKDGVIKPGQYLALWRKQTKLALNNDNDSIKLISPDGRIADLVTYEESDENVSYVLDENFIWLTSSTPTPGEINVLNTVTPDNDSGDTSPTSTQGVLGVKQKDADIIETPTSSGKNKYIAIGASLFIILGLGAIKKVKNKA